MMKWCSCVVTSRFSAGLKYLKQCKQIQVEPNYWGNKFIILVCIIYNQGKTYIGITKHLNYLVFSKNDHTLMPDSKRGQFFNKPYLLPDKVWENSSFSQARCLVTKAYTLKQEVWYAHVTIFLNTYCSLSRYQQANSSFIFGSLIKWVWPHLNIDLKQTIRM